MLATHVTHATLTTPNATADTRGSGGFLVTADGRALPLREARLAVEACAGVATVVLRQRFENPYDEPLDVTYTMPLPVDGAVSGYAFELGERRIVGEVDRKARARQRYEDALVEGRTAGLVEQVRANLFTQELGNVPPRSSLTAEIRVDQRLAWLDDGRWEWRFPLAAGPRYMGAAGRVADEARNTLAISEAPLAVRAHLELSIRDTLTGGLPESASHPLRTETTDGTVRAVFDDISGVQLDRDVVVSWCVARPALGLSLDAARPARGNASLAAYGLLTLVPPAPGHARAVARDVCLLLDISGSMAGEPMAQLKRVCTRIIDTLQPQDRLELVAFSSVATRFARHAESATEDVKARARSWVERLQAGGGTEMVEGIIQALAPLGAESQRQVVLLTDGYVGFENEVVKTVAERLPRGARLHTVGVGAAVNRALTRPSARAGHGVELVIAPGEDAGAVCRRLLARLNAPIAVDVQVDGDAVLQVAPRELPDVFAGAPLLAAVKLRADGGTVRVTARTASGTWEHTLRVPPVATGEGPAHIATLYARESVEDIEMQEACTPSPDHARRIEAIGLDFQVATSQTTWIAVSTEVTTDPGSPRRHELMPQQLVHGLSAEGAGLRPAATLGRQSGSITGSFAAVGGAPGVVPPAALRAPQRPAGLFERMRASVEKKKEVFRQEPEASRDMADDAEGVGAPEADRPKADMATPKGAEDLKRLVAALQVLAGAWRSLVNREGVLEITAPAGGMAWILPNVVTVVLRNGEQLELAVRVQGSTRSGRVAAGLQVRVLVMFDRDVAAADIVLVRTDDWEVRTGA